MTWLVIIGRTPLMLMTPQKHATGLTHSSAARVLKRAPHLHHACICVCGQHFCREQQGVCMQRFSARPGIQENMKRRVCVGRAMRVHGSWRAAEVACVCKQAKQQSEGHQRRPSRQAPPARALSSSHPGCLQICLADHGPHAWRAGVCVPRDAGLPVRQCDDHPACLLAGGAGHACWPLGPFLCNPVRALSYSVLCVLCYCSRVHTSFCAVWAHVCVRVRVRQSTARHGHCSYVA